MDDNLRPVSIREARAGGALRIHPYLNLDGQCAEAFRFYEKTLGGKIAILQTIGESPMKDQVPPAMHGRVMHVHMDIDGLSYFAFTITYH